MKQSNELTTPSTVQPARSIATSSIELQRRGRASVDAAVGREAC
jgi:hypothetical protein